MIDGSGVSDTIIVLRVLRQDRGREEHRFGNAWEAWPQWVSLLSESLPVNRLRGKILHAARKKFSNDSAPFFEPDGSTAFVPEDAVNTSMYA